VNDALASMLQKYSLRTAEDQVNALREILQEVALCGLWRGKFFEHAAFYGDTALRILRGLDRFSEGMEFSMLSPRPGFDLTPYYAAIEGELAAWGFSAIVEKKTESVESAVESAFLKADTRQQLLVITAEASIASSIQSGRVMRIKFEVDTDPPPAFAVESRFLLAPVPFSVRTFDLPSFFAGKVHAALCRGWKNSVKGRDWYDLVWHVGRDTRLNLAHLEARLRQTDHYRDDAPLDLVTARQMLHARIENLDVAAARADVERFLVHPAATAVWTREFFHDVCERITA
jgi:hypothetical protein